MERMAVGFHFTFFNSSSFGGISGHLDASLVLLLFSIFCFLFLLFEEWFGWFGW